jgi:Mn-dependent DtxR family transcriptional regulator
MSEELKEKIVEYLGQKGQAKNRDIARALGVEKGLVDKAIAELTRDGKAEYRTFGGISVVALAGKEE